jgi:hypothetical protein
MLTVCQKGLERRKEDTEVAGDVELKTGVIPRLGNALVTSSHALPLGDAASS